MSPLYVAKSQPSLPFPSSFGSSVRYASSILLLDTDSSPPAVMGYSIALLVFAIQGQNRGQKAWTSTVKQGEFFGDAPAPTNAPGGAPIATPHPQMYQPYPVSATPPVQPYPAQMSHDGQVVQYPVAPAQFQQPGYPPQPQHMMYPGSPPPPQGMVASQITYPGTPPPPQGMVPGQVMYPGSPPPQPSPYAQV